MLCLLAQLCYPSCLRQIGYRRHPRAWQEPFSCEQPSPTHETVLPLYPGTHLEDRR
jgi:hypothetical protein